MVESEGKECFHVLNEVSQKEIDTYDHYHMWDMKKQIMVVTTFQKQ